MSTCQVASFVERNTIPLSTSQLWGDGGAYTFPTNKNTPSAYNSSVRSSILPGLFSGPHSVDRRFGESRGEPMDAGGEQPLKVACSGGGLCSAVDVLMRMLMRIRIDKEPVEQLKEYLRDYNVTKQLTRSQTTEDYDFKLPETKRSNKHTSCLDNEYIYPPSRKVSDRVPQLHAHGTTEMRRAYTPPTTPSRLVTDKDQFRHPATLFINPPTEPSWQRELEPLDTTHDGYVKYLDPYLTTSRLHHRPYTADQLEKISNSKDVVTYYTYKDMPWIRTPKPQIGEWWIPVTKPKSMYDREKFKEDSREIRTHNKLKWVPGTFRTESRDNYVCQTSRPESQIHNFEEEVSTLYQRYVSNMQTNEQEEHSTVATRYTTEGTTVGSRKPLCSVFDQYVEKNKRLEKMSMHIG